MHLIVIVLYLVFCVLAFLFCRTIWRASNRSPAKVEHMDVGTSVLLGSAVIGDGTQFDSSGDCAVGHAASFDVGDCSSHH